MPRRSSGPRLWFDQDRGKYTIIDGRSNHRTGFGPAEIGRAEKALRDYIEGKHKPAAGPDPLLADVIAAYAEEHVKHLVSGKHISYDLEKLTKWWGTKKVTDISATGCRAYIAHRAAPTSARRELSFLNAAIQYWKANHAPLMPTPKITKPQKPEPRPDFMTRQQAAKFLWHARRTPHLYRFFLIGWYTGSRRSVITGLKWSMIDLESGVMQRKPRNAVRTKKRSPPVRIGARLLCHFRRWRRLDDKAGAPTYVVNFRGEKIDRPVSSWARIREAAGLPEYVVPHVLRHSRATHGLKQGVSPWELANALGMSVKVLIDVYGHHSPDWQKDAANVR
jgi:integrase